MEKEYSGQPPVPPLLAPSTKRIRKRKSAVEKAEVKRKLEQARSQTRVNIGEAFLRWRLLRDSLGLRTDAVTAAFLLDSHSSMSSASLCYAEGCANGENLLQQWSMNKCDVHGCFMGLDSCTCDPPFRLFPFPTEKRNAEWRQKWIQAFKRPDPRDLKKLLPPRQCHRVCSAHFVDGAPSEANPNPTLNLRPSSPVRGNDGTRPQGLKRRRIDGPNPAPAPLPSEIAGPSAVFYTLSVIIGVLLSLWRKAVREKDGLRKENCKLKAETNQLQSQVSKLKELINGLETNRTTESKEKHMALPEPLTSRNESNQCKQIQNRSIIAIQPHKTGPAPSQSQALEVMTQELAKSQAQLAVQTAPHPVMNGCQVYWIYQPVGQPMLLSSQQPSTINQMASISNSSTQLTSTNNQLDSNYNSPSSGENVKTEPVMVSLKCEDTEERTERKAECLLSGEQENVLNNIKKEEKEEDWEENSVKMESDIRVRPEDVCLKKEEEG